MPQEPSTPQEFRSDLLVVSMQEEPGCQVVWDVEVTPQGVAAAELNALRSVTKRVSIPGFRKGRAPEPLIRKQFGHAIRQELADSVLNTAFQEAIQLTQCYPFSENSLQQPKLHSLSLEEGAKIQFRFERFPTVPQLKFEGVAIERPAIQAVEEKEIDSEVDSLREDRSKFEPADRPLKTGDYTELTIDRLDGEEATRLFEKERFQLSQDRLANWLYTLLVGKKGGEVFEGTSELDPNAGEEEKRQFEPQRLRVLVESVLEERPPSDEELVQELKLASMEELRSKIRERLESNRKEEEERELRLKLWTGLIEQNPFEVPQTLVNNECRQIIREQVERMHREGLSDAIVRERRREIEEGAAAEAKLRLQIFYIVQELSESEKIEVTKEEVQKKLSPMLLYHRLLHPQGETPDFKTLQEHAHYLALQGKIEEQLLSRVTLSN